MYPFLRMGKELLRVRRMAPLGLLDKHEAYLRIYPWDIDIFMELNNGRTLTLFDVPRVGLAVRCGLWGLMKRKKYGLTVAGVAIQYRRRITCFQKIRITAQCIGVDEKFIYIVQNAFHDDKPCTQALFRMALFKNGIVSPKEIIEQEFGDVDIPALPEWAENFRYAANQRPWPPKE